MAYIQELFPEGAKFRGPSGVQGEAPVKFYDLTINYVQLYLTLLTTDNAIPHVLTVLKSLKFSK